MSLSVHIDTEGLDIPGLTALGMMDGLRLMDALGTEGVSQTQRRIKHEKTSPDGEAWKPLNPDYEASKKGGGILESKGHLLTSITHQIDGDSTVSWGSNLIYAAIHQQGGRITPKNGKALIFGFGNDTIVAGAVTIPARPYLGISADNQSQLELVVVDFLRTTINESSKTK